MDVAKWLMSQWDAIVAAPAVYFATAIVVWIVAAKFTKATLGDQAAAARERVEYIQQRLSEAQSDKDTLIARLQTYGEDIDQIKREMAMRLPIYVGPNPPENPREGDLWIDTSSPNNSLKQTD